jgi:DNA invertase Pin-like site-specific DNA recombinase
MTGSGPGMPVVLYLRKSNKTKNKTRDETVSIQDQRHDLYELCQNRGWKPIREYVDDGRSASKNDKKRVEFARMLADCEHADYRAVVVWDLSRLTRKDSVDAGKAAAVFKDNHILVVSRHEGEIDLNTETGRLIWNIHCESNNAFAMKVSGGTIRGRDGSLRRGNWPHGFVPYGYRRQYWEGAMLVKDMHRRDPAGKARHWVTKIVPDPDEAKFAEKVIRDFATRDISIRGLAIEMQRLGAPTFAGKPWSAGQIKDIIRCPAYYGSTAIGYSAGWKRSVATQKMKKGSKGKGYEAHAHSQPQAHEGGCPAIIDRETWQQAYDRLEKQGKSHHAHAGKSSPLSGIIYCGHCGKSMVKNTKKGITRFVCATASKNSANPTCKQWTIQEADLLPILTTRLVEAVDFKLLESLAAKPDEANHKQQLADLERQEADLTKQVSKAARNLALCEPGNYDEVQAVLTELKGDLDRVKNTAHMIRTAADKTELKRAADWWRSQRGKLVYLKLPQTKADEAFKAWGVVNPHLAADGRLVDAKAVIPATGDMFRGLLKQLNARLTLHFTPKAQGPGAKKQYYAVEWGRLEATLDGHSFDGTGPASARAPTAARCSPRCTAPATPSGSASTTTRPTPVWTPASSRPTPSCPTPACC